MTSILRKATWPALVALAMVLLIGAFGAPKAALAIDGDICAYETDAPKLTQDAEGNWLHVINLGQTYGLVFHLEDDYGPNVEVRIDSETGSARITSKAEILDYEGDPSIGHILVTPPASTQVVDTIEPDDFDDADGNDLTGINAWLLDVGYSAFAGDGRHAIDEDDDYCGGNSDDGWGFIDFKCIEYGIFSIDILTPDDTEETGMTVKFNCPAPRDANDATITASPGTLEIQPVGTSKSVSKITVTVTDDNGRRLDGAEVTLTTDNCIFTKNADGASISTASGGKVVTTHTNTNGTSDSNFLADNPDETEAGTAEVNLDCGAPGSVPGKANIVAVVERDGADKILNTTVTVIGPTASLVLTLSQPIATCGNPITVTVDAKDAIGQVVSDGTWIYITTDTSSGVVGGVEGAQGGAWTASGKIVITIATDPSKPGTHTVAAATGGVDLNGKAVPIVVVNQTYACSVPAAAPAVTAPAAGQGIKPPSTGDAGLVAAETGSNWALFAIVGMVVLSLAATATVKVARR